MAHARIYPTLNAISWSDVEKKAARRAFDTAYSRECGQIIAKLKTMAATASAPHDMWRIHDYLSKKRRQTDEKYDYRYSVLLFVFARLISEGWLTVDDLQGLRQDKIEKITIMAADWRAG